MQTFLPFPEFEKSARALDYRRLGKQRVEADQILTTILTGRKAWANHPAVRMWRDFQLALAAYRDVCIREWVRRGYKNTMLLSLVDPPLYDVPPWLGREDFHRSHQSNLIRKLPEHYGPLFPEVPSDLPYVWPIGASDG
jgi:hypothetical protein